MTSAILIILILVNIANLWYDWRKVKIKNEPAQKVIIKYEVKTDELKAQLKAVEYEINDFHKRTKIPVEIECSIKSK